MTKKGGAAYTTPPFLISHRHTRTHTDHVTICSAELAEEIQSSALRDLFHRITGDEYC